MVAAAAVCKEKDACMLSRDARILLPPVPYRAKYPKWESTMPMPKVLLLDDDKHLLAALKNMLVDRGFDIHCSDTAAEAVVMVDTQDFDFVLVDYKMPENDGIWFMQNAKLPRKTKVLLMTAYVNRAVIKRMFELGVSGYIIKPFAEEELLRHLSFHSSGDAAAEPAATDS